MASAPALHYGALGWGPSQRFPGSPKNRCAVLAARSMRRERL